MLFAIIPTLFAIQAEADLVQIVHEKPSLITESTRGNYLIDFGKVAFGNIELTPNDSSRNPLTVHFGEALQNGQINRRPPGTVRYSVVHVAPDSTDPFVVAPKPDARNTETNSPNHPPAILTPKKWGTLIPFRWVEIEGWKGPLTSKNIKRRAAFDKSWKDNASHFECSDPTLNRIWDLCKYSIKATTFAGIFVDGDRERIPYEADAYLNQLSYYSTSKDNRIPRATFDHLMKYATWPTEWAFHMIFMAHADWMQTGDKQWLAQRYDALKPKLLPARLGADGLIHSTEEHRTRTDIVDWPTGERDGFIFGETNTVVNAFYLRSLELMHQMAAALGKNEEAKEYADRYRNGLKAFRQKCFDPLTGLFRDGAGINHSSVHSNLFPLAFGLTPERHRAETADWLATQGMRCSVYAAQYLLEGLFEQGKANEALGLILAYNDRSWRHMVESGTTITWEAWDQKYKPNQDWNHAWGAAPANLLPRYILGVQPNEPGWKSALIRPNPGSLTYAKGTAPTPLGPIKLEVHRGPGLMLRIQLPKDLPARIQLPLTIENPKITVNGQPARFRVSTTYIELVHPVIGDVVIKVN